MSEPPLKKLFTGPEHEAFKAEALELLQKHCAVMGAEQVLALMANMVGQAAAQLDQRRFTPEAASAIIRANIEAGNRHALGPLANFKGTKQ